VDANSERKIIASAPGRAGILGNPTDGYGGSVISCSLAERAKVTLSPISKKGLEVKLGEESIVLSSRSDFRLQGDFFDCVRAVIQFLRLYDLKVKIEITSDIPVQAGLAGSTAILTSLIGALLRVQRKKANKYYIAELVRQVELNFLRVQCGYQDQYMTVFGGLNYMDFRDKERYRSLSEEFYATMEPLTDMVEELPFLVAHTGVARNSGVILKPIRERWLEGERLVVEGYRRIASLCRRGKRALLEADWPTFGRFMDENHRIQQELGASGEENDRLINVAREEGALGAKLAGAGGGGSIIVLHPDLEKIARVLKDAGAECILHLAPGPGLMLDEG